MIFWRCKCGEATMWESGMPPADCSGCDKCGTTYATHPDDHKPLATHELKPVFSRNTGELDGSECKRCYKRFK